MFIFLLKVTACFILSFCPSLPGIGGNLVAIQSSRISTYLHFHSAPGEVPDEAKGCYYPCRTFCGSGEEPRHRTTARVYSTAPHRTTPPLPLATAEPQLVQMQGLGTG